MSERIRGALRKMRYTNRRILYFVEFDVLCRAGDAVWIVRWCCEAVSDSAFVVSLDQSLSSTPGKMWLISVFVHHSGYCLFDSLTRTCLVLCLWKLHVVLFCILPIYAALRVLGVAWSVRLSVCWSCSSAPQKWRHRSSFWLDGRLDWAQGTWNI